MTPRGPVTTRDRTYAVYYVPDVSGHWHHDQVVYAHPNGLCVVCLAERHPIVTGEVLPSSGDDDDDGEGRAAATGDETDAADGTSTGAAAATGDKRKREGDGEGGDGPGPEPGARGGRPSRHRPKGKYSPIASVDYTCGKGEGKGNEVNIRGKKKRGAKTLQENSGLCWLVDEAGMYWIARACVRGKLIETNERLAKEPQLCTRFPTASGFLAIISAAPADMQRLRETGMNREAYEALRAIEAR